MFYQLNFKNLVFQLVEIESNQIRSYDYPRFTKMAKWFPFSKVFSFECNITIIMIDCIGIKLLEVNLRKQKVIFVFFQKSIYFWVVRITRLKIFFVYESLRARYLRPEYVQCTREIGYSKYGNLNLEPSMQNLKGQGCLTKCGTCAMF